MSKTFFQEGEQFSRGDSHPMVTGLVSLELRFSNTSDTLFALNNFCTIQIKCVPLKKIVVCSYNMLFVFL